MRTPISETWAQFSEALREFLNNRCILLENRLCCRKCGTFVAHSRVVVAIHAPAFHYNCATFDGRAWVMTLPYCPQCEQKPSERGCLHISLAEPEDP